jgi:hypothetical protein
MRRTIMAGLVALLAGCGSASTMGHAPGTAAASPAHAVPGCAGHPGIRLATRPVSLCTRQVRGADGGTLYWSRYPHTYQYYWQPKAGDMLVTETFYLPGGPLGMPIAWDGRLVTLGDGCVADDTGPAKHQPTSCIVAQEQGRFRGMTPAEHQSVADFWSVMRGFPAGQW